MRLDQNFYRPIFSFNRQGTSEILVSGRIVFCTEGVDQNQDAREGESFLFLRSLLKPWQLLFADVVEDDPFWTLGFASHSGEEVHITALKKMADHYGVSLELLQCPDAFPLSQLKTYELSIRGESKQGLYHPCSGKHLAFLIACVKHGWCPHSYLDPDHVMSVTFRDKLFKQFDIKPDFKFAVDSCGAQTCAMRTRDFLFLANKFAVCNDRGTKIIRSLWSSNPVLVGGKDRLDTALIELGRGQILAKEGADGLLLVQTCGEKSNQGCLVKIASGYDRSYLLLGLLAALTKNLGSLNPPMLEVFQYLQNHRGRVVPGDQQLEFYH